MTSKHVVLRKQADQDIDEALRFYLDEGAEDAAGEFIAAVEQALGHVGRHPAIGSLRHAHELGLPDLRCWPIKVFPYLIFYVDRPDRIDVWRVLHGSRDIPAWMDAPIAE